MKKLNKNKTVWMQRIAAFLLAASIAALVAIGVMPMENVKALNEIASAEQEADMAEDWSKGIVADNEAPGGDDAPEMIIEPKGANSHGFFNADVKAEIDVTKPEIAISFDSENALNGRYYNSARKAQIKINELNFDASLVEINVTKDGKPFSPIVSQWQSDGNNHAAYVDFTDDGDYTISVKCKDLAGNDIAEDKASMPIKFIIDTTLPEITISGVKNNSANAGAVVPIITVLDKNIELFNTQITLTTGRGKDVDISTDIAAALTEGGFTYTLNGLDAKADDIYYLEINASDKAQNASKTLCRFSLNRRGSAYDVTSFEKVTKRYYNSYNTLEDIKIIEMNVDKVEDFELYLSHNTDIIYGTSGGRPQDADRNTLPASALYDLNVSGSEDTGYVYTYTLYRENFALEGTYRLGIYSKDRAGNEVNNLLELNGEEIQFIIDNSAPSVVIEGIEDNEVYNAEAREAHVSAQDNFKLASAEIILVNRDGKALESWDYFDLVQKEGDIVTITIGRHDEELSLLYRAADAAGNEICALRKDKSAKTDFLITDDKFVQVINKPEKTPTGRFTIFSLYGISCLGLMAICAAFMKKYR